MIRKQKRDKTQVYVDALIQCKTPVMKTKIMFKLGGNHKIRKIRFAQLLDTGLLEQTNEPENNPSHRQASWYKTTQRGYYAISLMKEINNILFENTTKHTETILLNAI